MFDVKGPPNENRSHRLNTALPELVEMARTSPPALQTIKQWQEKAPDTPKQYWYYVLYYLVLHGCFPGLN